MIKLNNDISFVLHTGAKINFFNGYSLYQPSCYELSEIVNSDTALLKVIQLICLSNIETVNAVKEVPKLQIFLFLLFSEGKILSTEEKFCIFKLINLIFKDYRVVLNNKEFILESTNEDKPNLEIDNEKFEVFQDIVYNMFGLSGFVKKDNKEEYNPIDDKAREIAEKLKKRHTQLAEMQAKELEGKSIFGNLLSICAVGASSLTEYAKTTTLYQLLNQKTRVGMQERYKQLLKIKLSLAGSSNKDKLEDWMTFI